jgi:hypothetical protein
MRKIGNLTKGVRMGHLGGFFGQLVFKEKNPRLPVGVKFSALRCVAASRLLTMPDFAAHTPFLATDLASAGTATSTAHAHPPW